MDWLNMLKFKASFGQQGNDDLLYADGLTKNYYPSVDQFKVTGADGSFSDGALYYKGNPDISWETSTTYNVGFDFSMLNNKLNGSIEYFGRESSDMLYNRPKALSLGYDAMPMNIGSMRNSGLEIDLNYQILANKGLTWDVNLNSTFIKNKILKLSPELNGQFTNETRIYQEGKSMYCLYLPKYNGVDPKTGEALYWAKDENGNLISTTDYSLANDTYRMPTKDLLAKVYGGFGTSLKFYGLDFSLQCSYQLGGQIYDSGYQRLMHGGTSSSAGTNWHMDILNAWSENNKSSNIPRLDALDKYASASSDRWLVSSDYLSINNVTLGYTLPSSLTNKFLINKLRLYMAIDNIALFSARKGLDPRQSFTSASTARYTPIRTISGGLSLTF